MIRLDAALAAEFLDESGKPKTRGAVVANTSLAQTLSDIRLQGADGFYKGAAAARISAWSAQQGGMISAGDMAAMVSIRGAAAAHNVGGLTAYLPGPRTGAGAFTSTMLANLSGIQPGTAGSSAAIGQALTRTLSGFGVGALPRDLGSTGFAAVDQYGEAASCAVTLNGPFGSGRTAADTGVTLAASPAGPTGLASAFLTPLIATDGSGSVVLAATGSGGPNGTAAAAYALLTAAGGRPLGSPGDLLSTGMAPFDTVNVISCSGEACVALSDPGGHGLGAMADAGL